MLIELIVHGLIVCDLDRVRLITDASSCYTNTTRSFLERRRISEEGRREPFWVPATVNIGSLASTADFMRFFQSQLNMQGTDVFIQTLQICRTRDLSHC